MIGVVIDRLGTAVARAIEAAKRTPEQIAARQRARALTRAQRAFHRALRGGDADAINAAKQHLEALAHD